MMGLNQEGLGLKQKQVSLQKEMAEYQKDKADSDRTIAGIASVLKGAAGVLMIASGFGAIEGGALVADGILGVVDLGAGTDLQSQMRPITSLGSLGQRIYNFKMGRDQELMTKEAGALFTAALAADAAANYNGFEQEGEGLAFTPSESMQKAVAEINALGMKHAGKRSVDENGRGLGDQMLETYRNASVIGAGKVIGEELVRKQMETVMDTARTAVKYNNPGLIEGTANALAFGDPAQRNKAVEEGKAYYGDTVMSERASEIAVTEGEDAAQAFIESGVVDGLSVSEEGKKFAQSRMESRVQEVKKENTGQAAAVFKEALANNGGNIAAARRETVERLGTANKNIREAVTLSADNAAEAALRLRLEDKWKSESVEGLESIRAGLGNETSDLYADYEGNDRLRVDHRNWAENQIKDRKKAQADYARKEREAAESGRRAGEKAAADAASKREADAKSIAADYALRLRERFSGWETGRSEPAEGRILLEDLIGDSGETLPAKERNDMINSLVLGKDKAYASAKYEALKSVLKAAKTDETRQGEIMGALMQARLEGKTAKEMDDMIDGFKRVETAKFLTDKKPDIKDVVAAANAGELDAYIYGRSDNKGGFAETWIGGDALRNTMAKVQSQLIGLMEDANLNIKNVKMSTDSDGDKNGFYIATDNDENLYRIGVTDGLAFGFGKTLRLEKLEGGNWVPYEKPKQETPEGFPTSFGQRGI
jgi:hypothetical protein